MFLLQPSNEIRSSRSEPVSLDTGQLSKVGFVGLMAVCALAILLAILLFIHTLIKRRDRLNGYIPAGGKESRKPSERPLVGTASPSPSGSIVNASIVSSRNDSLVKQPHQESTSSCSTSSPPPYQEALEQGEKQVGCLTKLEISILLHSGSFTLNCRILR